MSLKTSRRKFLKTTGAIAAGSLCFPGIIPSRLLGANAPSKRVTLGFIGVGSQGLNANLKTFLGLENTQVTAVCDVFLSRAEKARQMVNAVYGNNDVSVYQDFRHIINDPGIDAVVISTPDHWHTPMALMALEAGKDVFCEKPTLCIEDGKTLVDAFAQRDRIFQAGIEDRSLTHFHKMVEWVKNGAIGTLRQVKVRMPAGVENPLEKSAPVPDDLDWNLWQGPAAWHDYTENRTGEWHWRYIDLYSKGPILDMGTHLVDTAQLGINDPDVCPIEVEGSGEIPLGCESNVPLKYRLNYKYGNGVELEVTNGPKGYWDPQACYLEFIGDNGWIRRDGWYSPLEASDISILRKRYKEGESKHWPIPKSEQRNFLESVRTRKNPSYPAKDLHEMSTTLHMGVISIQLGRKLQWNPRDGAFINDDQANQLCLRPKSRNWEAEC